MGTILADEIVKKKIDETVAGYLHVYDYLFDQQRLGQRPPTLRQIARDTFYGRTTIFRYLMLLHKLGVIRRTGWYQRRILICVNRERAERRVRDYFS